jgi:glycosyltransferase involved in cell wall biosynthesis
MSRPKVLYVVTEDWYFRNHRLAHAQLLLESGFDVHLATRSSSAATSVASTGVSIHELNLGRSSLNPLATARELLALRRIVRKVDPDIIHGVALKPVLLCMLLLGATRRPRMILAISGLGLSSVRSPRKIRVLAFLLRTASRSKRVRLLFQNPVDLKLVDAAPERCDLIPGVGVDAQQFAAQTPAPPPPPWRFVYLGRAVRSKGITRVPAVAKKLATAGVDVQFALYCTVDPSSPGSLNDDEITKISTAAHVEWMGPTAHPEDALQHAHAAVLPTEGGEGVSKFVLEAMACGRPILTTRTPGSEVVIDGTTGLLFDAADTDAFASAVERFTQLTEDARLAMGEACRSEAGAKYSLDVIGPRIVALHQSLLGSQPT